jgi:hypothetical protein
LDPHIRIKNAYSKHLNFICIDSPELDWQIDLEKRVTFCTKWAVSMGFVRVGDPIVLVSGWRQGSGFTNTMRIVYAAGDTTVD